MTFRLLPSILWVLDEEAQEAIALWHKGLDDRARNFIRVAGDWEKVLEIVHEYRQINFNTVLRNSGVSTEQQLHVRRINIVLISSVLTNNAPSWSLIEKKLDGLSNLVNIQRHRIILHQARTNAPDDPQVSQIIDSAAINGTREAPWFLSNHITGGFLIGDDQFFEHLCNLLNALLLAQREEAGAQGDIARVFFVAPPAPDHVRLAGFSRISIANLLKEIATALSKTVLHRAYHGTLEPGLITAMERILSEKIKQFLSGGLGADQVLEVIIGRGGFKSWSTAQILRDGKDLLRRQLHRLSVEALLQTTQSTPPPGFFTRMWRKLPAFSRKAPPVVSGPDKENLDYLRTNLKKMLEIIEVIEEQAKGGGPRRPDIPTDLINSWSSTLRDKLLAALENRWQDPDILPRLSMVIERSVTKFFSEALHAWQLDGELLREMAKAMEHGDLLRFSSKLIGDQQVQAEAIVTSLMIGDHIKHGGRYIRSAFLKVWPGRLPLFLAVCQPVPLEHIQA